jgi:integrase
MARWDADRGVWRITANAAPPGGKRRRVVRTFAAPNTRSGRREAEQAEMRLRVQVLDQLERAWPGGRSPGTFAATAAAWVDRNRHRWSPKTVKETEYALRRFILPELGGTPLEEVSPAQIEATYAAWERRYSASGVRRWHGMIRAVFADAERLDLVDRNPMRRVRPGGGPAPERARMPEPAEVRRIIDAARPAPRVFFELGAATGARRGTLVALRWRNVDLAGDTMTVTFLHAVAQTPDGDEIVKGTKANRPYTVTVAGGAADVVRDHRRRCAETALALGVADFGDLFVFSSDGGLTPWALGYPTHAWQYACIRAGLPGFRLHDLRHFAATRMLANGIPNRVVADRLGCTEANVIRTYSHRVPTTEDARAAQVMADTLSVV